MNSYDKVKTLQENIGHLTGRDFDAATSLLNQLDQRGLTDKQLSYVGALADRSVAPAKIVEINGMSAVIELFDRAAENLQFPKTRLAFANGDPLVLSRAGTRARLPGTVNVTDGGSYGSNTWYGRITRDGKFEPNRRIAPDQIAAAVEILTELGADPEAVAASYGKRFGNCCFCNRDLTDARSTEVGYGPTCASHFGLAWGVK